MRIKELYVDGFNILHDLVLSESDFRTNLTVFYGPNEAGKSTLMAFIRALFFGFNLKDEPAAEPLRGGRSGGHMVLEDEEGLTYRIERRQTGTKKGRVRLVLPDGTKRDESYLRNNILRGVTPLVFRNVFAFDVDELRRLEELRNEEVSAHVWGATTGLEAGKFSNALRKLNREMDDLFKPRGSKSRINKLLKEINALEEDIRRLRRQPGEYDFLQEQVRRLQKQREDLIAQKRKIEKRRGWLQGLLEARRIWIDLQDVRSQLEEIPEVAEFPEFGIERLDSLNERQRELNDEYRKKADELKVLTEKLNKLVIDEKILNHRLEIEQLEEERRLFVGRRDSLAKLAAETKRAAAAYEEEKARLGPGWTDEKVAAVDLSVAVAQQVQDFKSRLAGQDSVVSTSYNEWQNAQMTLEDKDREWKEAKRALETHVVPEAPTGVPLAERVNILNDITNAYHRLELVKIERNSGQQRLNDLQRQRRSMETPVSGMPKLFTGAVVILLVLSTMAAFLADPLFGGIFLVVDAAAAGLALRYRRQVKDRQVRQEEERRALDIKIREMENQLEDLASEEKDLCRRIKQGAAALVGRDELPQDELDGIRRALEDEKQAHQVRANLEQAVHKAEQALEGARTRVTEAEKRWRRAREEYEQLHREWEQWLERQGLPVTLDPTGALHFLDAVQKARDRYREWQRAREAEKEVREQVQGYLSRVNKVLANLGRPVAAVETAADRVISLRDDLRRGEEASQEYARLEEEIVKEKAALKRQEDKIRQVEEEKMRLMRAGGAEDEETFRHRAINYARRETLIKQRAELERQLQFIAGTPGDRERMKRELAQSSYPENEGELTRLNEEMAEIDDKYSAIGEQIGSLKNELERMEAGDDLAAKMLEKEMKLSLLKQVAEEWQVRQLCRTLLDLAREKHERERQPVVIQRASTYIRPLTSGTYRQVIAPVGQTDLLEVEDGSGRRVSVSDLSRGAASQLYLAVRLALAREYASMVSLPIILDDVLVDFDPVRLQGALGLLGKLAAEHQILMFTCHKHILEALRDTEVEFGLVELG
ncbi:MAG: AAA family ATPase [Peptococcaceae bacterium]|nr:AAA family ATPase [Peptococcaceae bacterium]